MNENNSSLVMLTSVSYLNRSLFDISIRQCYKELENRVNSEFKATPE
jgi:hypothetical protein